MDSIGREFHSFVPPPTHSLSSQKETVDECKKITEPQKHEKGIGSIRRSKRLRAQKKAHLNFIDTLPRELALKVFSYLTSQDLLNCCLVNKSWASIGQDPEIQRLIIHQEVAFGALQWNQYFGDVGKEPPLRADIRDILLSPCPFFEGKLVRETHRLFLMPSTVNGRPITLSSMEDIMGNPKKGTAVHYIMYWDVVSKELGDVQLPNSYWCLMLKQVAPESICEGSYWESDLVCGQKEDRETLYKFPRLLEAVTLIALERIQRGIKLFTKDFTICQENVGDKLAVGWRSDEYLANNDEADSEGIQVDVNYGDGKFNGVGPVRRF